VQVHGTFHLTARRRRYLLLRTWRDLRLSAARGRPITLPNLLRLHRRRLWREGVDPEALAPDDPASPRHVRSLYLRCQPIHSGQLALCL
jgi:hypothetical protein